jgi:hypothetical protein
VVDAIGDVSGSVRLSGAESKDSTKDRSKA